MSWKLPVNNFEWIKDTSQFNEDFIKNYNEESDERYFLQVDVQYLEIIYALHNDLPFLPERMKIEKVKEPTSFPEQFSKNSPGNAWFR